jgi:hypothetical protein
MDNGMRESVNYRQKDYTPTWASSKLHHVKCYFPIGKKQPDAHHDEPEKQV